jgi:hypothetical protein
MKVDALKKLIKEAVKEAIQEELAKKPEPVMEMVETPAIQSTGNPIMDMLNMTKRSMTNEEYKNVMTTESTMTQAPDFRSMMSGMQEMPAPRRTLANAPKVGLDISNLDFVKKAASVFKQAEEKSKSRML